MNLNVDDLRTALNSLKRSGAWRRIAQRCGVNHSTLVRFGSGEIESPRLITCQAIHAAIEAERRALARNPGHGKRRSVKRPSAAVITSNA